jgi:hypothetical protein
MSEKKVGKANPKGYKGENQKEKVEEKVGKANPKGYKGENQKEKVEEKVGSEVTYLVKKISLLEYTKMGKGVISSLTFSIVDMDGSPVEVSYIAVNCE